MIQNEREYEITKAQVDKFSRALDLLFPDETDPLKRAERDGVASVLADLREEVAVYEALRDQLDQLCYERGVRDGEEGGPPLEASPRYLEGFRAGRYARREAEHRGK